MLFESFDENIKLVDLESHSDFIKRFFEPDEIDKKEENTILYNECRKPPYLQTEATSGDVLNLNIVLDELDNGRKIYLKKNDSDGKTPFHYCCTRVHQSVIDYVLSMNSKTTLKAFTTQDNNGTNALQICFKLGEEDPNFLLTRFPKFSQFKLDTTVNTFDHRNDAMILRIQAIISWIRLLRKVRYERQVMSIGKLFQAFELDKCFKEISKREISVILRIIKFILCCQKAGNGKYFYTSRNGDFRFR